MDFPLGECLVCQDKATGFHYGLITCDGCKIFFKRSLLQTKRKICYLKERCAITPQTRTRCKACRFTKCLEMGMFLKAGHRSQNTVRKEKMYVSNGGFRDGYINNLIFNNQVNHPNDPYCIPTNSENEIVYTAPATQNDIHCVSSITQNRSPTRQRSPYRTAPASENDTRCISSITQNRMPSSQSYAYRTATVTESDTHCVSSFSQNRSSSNQIYTDITAPVTETGTHQIASSSQSYGHCIFENDTHCITSFAQNRIASRSHNDAYCIAPITEKNAYAIESISQERNPSFIQNDVYPVVSVTQNNVYPALSVSQNDFFPLALNTQYDRCKTVTSNPSNNKTDMYRTVSPIHDRILSTREYDDHCFVPITHDNVYQDYAGMQRNPGITRANNDTGNRFLFS